MRIAHICTVSYFFQYQLTKSGNASIAINVRHAPGRGSVSPSSPVAIEGRSAVLRCAADPPGYPEPTFEWWKGPRDTRYV